MTVFLISYIKKHNAYFGGVGPDDLHKVGGPEELCS